MRDSLGAGAAKEVHPFGSACELCWSLEELMKAFCSLWESSPTTLISVMLDSSFAAAVAPCPPPKLANACPSHQQRSLQHR